MSLGGFLLACVAMVVVPMLLIGILWNVMLSAGRTPAERQAEHAYQAGWWRGWLWGSWK